MATTPFSYNIDPEEARARLYESIMKQKENGQTQAEIQQQQDTYDDLSGSNVQKIITSTNKNDTTAKQLRLEKRFDTRAERLSNRIDRAANRGNVEKAGKLTEKLENLEMGGEATADWAGGGLTALQMAPSIIANLSQKPTTGGEANTKVLNSAAQFAQIGGAIAPGLGHFLGAVGGTLIGGITNKGWFDDVLKEEGKAITEAQAKERKQRLDMYMSEQTGDKLQSQTDAYAKALGYSDRMSNYS